ncbi:MAG TPA: response regulator [Oligoflexus sp.]|uniref:response regulator n=1 Tax=Oligoflexus sp. TaxID=1971216 RepID=UPI002D41B6B2|nr:response regulator [Oligoflexus sp.]HYX32449.1 response regulator [Oligoflexus sp.]
MKASYDLVIMDIQMPVMNGHDATKQLRSQGFVKPIIALIALKDGSIEVKREF